MQNAKKSDDFDVARWNGRIDVRQIAAWSMVALMAVVLWLAVAMILWWIA